MKAELPLGVVVATRELEFVYANGRKEKALVSIGTPIQGAGAECWHCPYTITATAFNRQQYTTGIDPVQALDLALGVISAELSYISKRHDGIFHFLGEPGHEFRSL